LADFIERCNESFVQQIEGEIFRYTQSYLDFDLFGREKAALDKVVNPADVWKTIRDISILVFIDHEPPGTLALCWTCDWEDEHGLQVLYRLGGDIRATIRGDDYFD
jgi:hypothetical protein